MTKQSPRWVVGTDRDDEFSIVFDNEQAALYFAEFDSQLSERTAVVARHDPDGMMTVIAEFVR